MKEGVVGFLAFVGLLLIAAVGYCCMSAMRLKRRYNRKKVLVNSVRKYIPH